MKSYTDLEQSKKLAEILPFESADMYYTPPLIKGHTDYIPHLKRKLPIDWDIEQKTPCWSLTALISVLPRVDIEKETWTDDTYDYRVKAYIDDGYVGDWFDNPVDACYDMIIKLNKDKLLYVQQ